MRAGREALGGEEPKGSQIGGASFTGSLGHSNQAGGRGVGGGKRRKPLKAFV